MYKMVAGESSVLVSVGLDVVYNSQAMRTVPS